MRCSAYSGLCGRCLTGQWLAREAFQKCKQSLGFALRVPKPVGGPNPPDPVLPPKALQDLLPDAASLDVRLLGSGMPSFWTVHVDEVELTVGLSGWTALDWAGRARFAESASSE